MAGKPTDELDHVDTLCERCHFPKMVYHLYNNHDLLVADQFDEVFGSAEPEMAKAFKLLGDGFLTADADGFVAHYEENLSLIESPNNKAQERIVTQNVMSNEDAANVLQQFGSLISELGVNGTNVFDESSLSHTKDEIKSAIVAVLSGDFPADKQDFAKGAVPALAFFQPGVGETSQALDSDKSSEQTWRSAVEADMKEIAFDVATRSNTEL